MDEKQKKYIINRLREMFQKEREITKVVIFGSFLNSQNPNDIDIAVFQNSKDLYVNLALKYRKLTRGIAQILPVDIIPLNNNANGSFLDEINSGEVIYEVLHDDCSGNLQMRNVI